MRALNAERAHEQVRVVGQPVHRIVAFGRVAAPVSASVEREHAVVAREFRQLRPPHAGVARERMAQHQPRTRIVPDFAVHFVVEANPLDIQSHVIPLSDSPDAVRLDSGQCEDSTDTNMYTYLIRYG